MCDNWRVSIPDPCRQHVLYFSTSFFIFHFSHDNQILGQYTYMNPLDIQQYLYCLTPVPNVLNDPKVLKGVTNIGKLDIVWKTNMGEKGRLQTSPLQRVVSSTTRQSKRSHFSQTASIAKPKVYLIARIILHRLGQNYCFNRSDQRGIS